jgi:hypothetical protein
MDVLSVPSKALGKKRSTGPRGVSIHALKAALKKNAGVYSLAARELWLDRTSVRQRVERHPELQQLIRDIDQEMGDAAEAVVKNDIIKGDVKTAKWYLQLKHRDRGYRTQTELTGADGAPLQLAPTVNINVNYVGSEKPDVEVL